MQSTLFPVKPVKTHKKCCVCGVEKLRATDFYANSSRQNRISSECKACEKQYKSDRYKRHREQAIAAGFDPKFQRACSACGEVKFATEFPRAVARLHGIADQCIPCRRITKRNLYHKRVSIIGSHRADPTSTKTCFICKKAKPAGQFHHSFITADLLDTYCITCKKIKERSKPLTFHKYATRMITSCRRRAERKMGLFDLDLDFIRRAWESQNGKCIYTGILMTHSWGKGYQDQIYSTNLSLDRIDSAKGYTQDNVCLCCAWSNRAKSTLSNDQFKIFIAMAFRHLGLALG